MTVASLSPRTSICKEVEKLLPCQFHVSWKTAKGERAVGTEIDDPTQIENVFRDCIEDLRKMSREIEVSPEDPFIVCITASNTTNPKNRLFRPYNPNPIAGIAEEVSSGDDEKDASPDRFEVQGGLLRRQSTDSVSADS